MPQLNIYVPEALAEELRDEAKRRGKSLSSLVVTLVSERLGHTGWSPDFLDEVAGRWEGDFPEIERPPASEAEGL